MTGLARITAPTSPWSAERRADPGGDLHARHQTLMRAYQSRYVVLPEASADGSIMAWLDRRYDPAELARLATARPALERALVAPLIEEAIAATAGADVVAYTQALLPQLRRQPENALTASLRANPDRAHHYRDFLLQSSADLLAEASASAFGVVGSFGAPQSALFRILIDEFGYGAHDRKHSVLYQAVMRDFGLSDAYDAYAPLLDTAAVELHNTIHCLFQNPRNVFLQVGFLVFAETAYQRSTGDHHRYLREFHPDADARYFAEHAHIDLHHTRMIIDDVALPMVAAYGPEAGAEIVAGAELTRGAFARAGSHLLAVGQAFAAAVAAGEASYAAPEPCGAGRSLSPCGAATEPSSARLQVGGLGLVSAQAFAGFPSGAIGWVAEPEERA